MEMSFVGFSIGDGIAWAWADAEAYYEDGVPARADAEKMGVSAGGLVVVGVGDEALMKEIAATAGAIGKMALMPAARTLRELAHELASSKRDSRSRKGDRAPAWTSFGLVGVEDGRLRGFSARETDDFRLDETEAWGMPTFTGRPRSANEAATIALRQLDVVRRQLPLATGRALTIAKIGTLGVAQAKLRLPTQ
jgi:hypothetical protein